MSAVLHALGVLVVAWLARPAEERHVDTVDIEMAPPPPKAEALPPEVARPPETDPAPAPQEPASTPPEPQHDEEPAPIDAGVDAPVDAPKKKKPDAAELMAEADAGVPDAEQVAVADAGTGDAGEQIVAVGSADTGSGSDVAPAGSGSGGPGVPAAVAMGSGSGAPGMTDEPAVDGAPTTAGTAANLLAYFPAGHVVTALVRFDRLRGTEWAAPTERLFRPMPDYHVLFGDRDANLATKIDTLVISSPHPRDATATTLVMHTALSRGQVRELLANPQAPISWMAAKGGMVGKRTGKVFPNDHRVLLSPWKGWFLLAQPDDLALLAQPQRGNLDAIEAPAKLLPKWLETLRTIEKESGDEKSRGPALVVTLASEATTPSTPKRDKARRYKFPDVGLGVTSLPAPDRLSLAMELDPAGHGWLVRGNMSFANEADAAEFVKTIVDAQQRITDSHVLSALLRRQHALDVVTGLSFERTGARVSYATSLSIAAARAVLAAAASTLDDYFGQPATTPPSP